jgi:hypothetical protein
LVITVPAVRVSVVPDKFPVPVIAIRITIPGVMPVVFENTADVAVAELSVAVFVGGVSPPPVKIALYHASM